MRNSRQRTARAMLIVLAAFVVIGCATTDDGPQGSSPADKLRKADRDPEIDGELQVTVSRTR